MANVKIAILFFLLPGLATGQSFERERSSEFRNSRSNSGSIDEQVSVKQLFWPYLLEVSMNGPAALAGTQHPDPSEIKARDAMAAFLSNPTYQCHAIFSTKKFVYGESLILTGEPKNIGCPEPAKFLPNCMVYEPIPMSTAEVSPRGPVVVHFLGRHGRPETAANLFSCVSTAAEIISAATRILAQASVSVSDPKTGNQVLITANLREKSRSAFSQALALTFTNNSFSPAVVKTATCRVPTSSGLDSRQGEVKCGELEYDQFSQSYRRGGVLVLDEQTLNGVKVIFANSTKSDKARSAGVADRRKARVE